MTNAEQAAPASHEQMSLRGLGALYTAICAVASVPPFMVRPGGVTELTLAELVSSRTWTYPRHPYDKGQGWVLRSDSVMTTFLRCSCRATGTGASVKAVVWFNTALGLLSLCLTQL